MNRRTATVFIDALFLMLLVLVLLPHKPEESKADEAKVGDLVVEISWPDCQYSDVDLWVKAPGDRPVGYSRLRGEHVSLLRDDLGTSESDCDRSELAASRELVTGEWVVNLHLYTDRDSAAPFDVHVLAWYRGGGSSVKHSIWSGHVTLPRYDAEVTAVRWRMEKGQLLRGSIHHTFTPLRVGGRSHGGGP